MRKKDNIQIHEPFSGYNQPQLDTVTLATIVSIPELISRNSKENIIKALKKIGGNYELSI